MAPAPSPAPGSARPAALDPAADAAAAAERVALIQHHVLAVLAHMRRSAKFRSFDPATFSLTPSPFAHDAHGANHAAWSDLTLPPVPAATATDAERDAYLDRCAALFHWVGDAAATASAVGLTTANDDVRISASSPTESAVSDRDDAVSTDELATTTADPAAAPATIHLHDTSETEEANEDDDESAKNPTPVPSPSASPRTATVTTSSSMASLSPSTDHAPLRASATQTNVALPAHVLLQGFEELLKRLATITTLTDLATRVPPLFMVTPFLRVIQSGDTTALITGAALASVHAFWLDGLLWAKARRDRRQVLALIVHTVAHARFEASSSATGDDVVLYRVLALVQDLVRDPAWSACLADEAVCELVEMAVAVWMLPRVAEPVRRLAASVLHHLVRVVFAAPAAPNTRAPSVACQLEIVRVLAAILAGDPHPASESLLVLAMSLVQHLVPVAHDAAVREAIRAHLMRHTLAWVARGTPSANEASDADADPLVVDRSLGVGLEAPASSRATPADARPTVNVVAMAWRTLHVQWQHLAPLLAPAHYELVLDLVLRVPRRTDPWEVREARAVFLRHVAHDANVLCALYRHLDCVPGRIDLFQNVVAHFARILEDQEVAIAVAGPALDFVHHLLLMLDRAPTQVDEGLRAQRARKLVLKRGLDLFTTSPEKALDYFVAQGLIPQGKPADAVAAFLFTSPGIDKRVVGEYLSKKDKEAVLKAYMVHFDFRHLRIDEAMRVLMLKFRIGGESQMIDRAIDCFAKHYFAQNPDQAEIANLDAGHILAFSVIMLNTDQHNRQVRNRMDFDAFCRNLRGLNNNKDFDLAFLDAIFTAIHTKEIKDVETLDEKWTEALVQPPVDLHAAVLPDTAAMIQDVYATLVQALLHSPEPRAMACLSLLARAHGCADDLLLQLAKLNQLAPFTGDRKAGTGLHHAHLILFLATVAHQMPNLSDTAQDVVVDAVSTLFVHDWLPTDCATYADPLRGRTVRIPVGTPVTTDRDVAATTAEPATSSASTPPPGSSSPQPRASSSLFSFISYLSTSFTATEPTDDEATLIRSVLARCNVGEILVHAVTPARWLAAADRRTHLASFYTECVVRQVERAGAWVAGPAEAERVCAILRSALTARRNPAVGPPPHHAMAAAVRLAAYVPGAAELAPAVAAALPAPAETLPTLASDAHFALLAPYTRADTYMDILRKPRPLAQVARVLRAHTSMAAANGGTSPLSDEQAMAVNLVVYRVIVRSQDASAVAAVLDAALDLLPFAARATAVYVEYVKIFAIVMFHPVAAVRATRALDRVLFASVKVEDGAVPAVVKNVLVPLAQQLLLDAKRGEDQVSVARLLCRYFMHHVDDGTASGDDARVAMWRQVLDVQLACIKRAPQLADPVVEAVKNALLVMDALGQFGTTTGGRNDLWRTTWAAIDPVLPTLREELFPTPPPPVAPVLPPPVMEEPAATRAKSPPPQAPASPAPAAEFLESEVLTI
ncbi:GDP/GTP exchange factor for ARF [Allomyces arbusculus]|nr:GDP/GTP exchange factor for ARF [Allomyces arbusculus]